MRKSTRIIFAGVCLATAAALVMAAAGQDPKPAEEKPAEFKIPEEEVKRVNPVRATAESLAQGRRIYRTDCVFCHGASGDGQGELAEPMELKMLDYTDPKSLEKFTDGELRYIILKGKGKMPPGDERLKDNQPWHLVNLVRSFAKKEAPAKNGSP